MVLRLKNRSTNEFGVLGTQESSKTRGLSDPDLKQLWAANQFIAKLGKWPKGIRKGSKKIREESGREG